MNPVDSRYYLTHNKRRI